MKLRNGKKKKKRAPLPTKNGVVEGGYYYARVLSIDGNRATLNLTPHAEFDKEDMPISFAFTAIGSDGAIETIRPLRITCHGDQLHNVPGSKDFFLLPAAMKNGKALKLILEVTSVASLRVGIRFSMPNRT